MRGYVLFIAAVAAFRLVMASPPELETIISEAELQAHVEFLASAELEGRIAPGRGSEIAQKYIATRFKQYGLETLEAAPGYYQAVPLTTQKTDYESTKITVKRGPASEELKARRDFYFFPRRGHNDEISGPLLLCGYGIHAPEYDYSDYEGADPRGKILLAFDGEPLNSEEKPAFTGEKKTKYSRAVVKARIAKERGALGLLIVQPPAGKNPPLEKILGRQIKGMHDLRVQLIDAEAGFPVFYLTQKAIAKVLGRDFDLSAYQKEIDAALKGDPKPAADTQITLQIRFKEIEEKSSANVIGCIPGRSEEAILVMAHHDHEGMKDGEIYFGADDNASGVAGLLGIAQAIASADRPPQRTIIFLSTGAEEKGSLGAQYFIQHPPYPLEKIAAAINMDEIGRDGSSQFRAMMDPSIPGEKDLLMVFYSGQTPELAQIAGELNNQGLNLLLEPVLRFHSSSDHVPFHQQKIPSMFFFTGFHSDYSRPTDTPDKIVYDKLTRVARLAAQLTWALANAEKLPFFDMSIKEVVRTRTYGN